MRISFLFQLKENKLPKDYRRGFASLIKHAISKADPQLYDIYYTGKHKIKPFTFSVYFPQQPKLQDDYFLVGDRAILNISTNDYRFASQLYNGMLSILNSSYPLFDNSVTLRTFNYHPLKKIKRDEVIFKTIDAMLITNKYCHIDVDGNQYDLYLTPEEDGFDEGLKFLVKEMVKRFLNYEGDFLFEYELIKNSVRAIPIWHYNQWNKGIKGQIRIKSHPEILQLIYDIGIGARRSQGFGMLEVANER
ncbi:MAG: CRISPR-associated endoribonuclease Cas6 [Ignavibacteria bacterium]